MIAFFVACLCRHCLMRFVKKMKKSAIGRANAGHVILLSYRNTSEQQQQQEVATVDATLKNDPPAYNQLCLNCSLPATTSTSNDTQQEQPPPYLRSPSVAASRLQINTDSNTNNNHSNGQIRCYLYQL